MKKDADKDRYVLSISFLFNLNIWNNKYINIWQKKLKIQSFHEILYVKKINILFKSYFFNE